MDWGLIWKYLPMLLEGLSATIWISLVAICTALLMGACLVLTGRSGAKWIRDLTRLYTETILGIPVLVLLYIVFFVFPSVGIVISPLAAGLVALTLYYSPYFAEVIRGAFNAIPSGLIEAGRGVGMSEFQIMQRIIAPQAFGIALPPLTGTCIGLVKDTAILSVISVVELAFQSKQVMSRTYAPFETYLVVALIYWSMLSLFEISMRWLERRVTSYRSH
jgi:His/Glu/Gln/Arg/opine family amino acid ABC transporter permease subunit